MNGRGGFWGLLSEYAVFECDCASSGLLVCARLHMCGV